MKYSRLYCKVQYIFWIPQTKQCRTVVPRTITNAFLRDVDVLTISRTCGFSY